MSIIITTKNEGPVIGRLISSIKNQTYKPKEIILVDNNSKDATVGIAKKMGVKIVNQGPERSAQRNFGARLAKGRYFLFADADMELAPDVVAQCVEVARLNKAIGGVAIPEESKALNFWEKVKAFERSFYNDKGDPFTDAARFFTREAFFKAGGYDETITGPEDWDLPETVSELGYKIGRIKSRIYHKERVPSPWILAGKKYYYAMSAYKYLNKHGIPVVGPKTIYFLRPVFYRNWKKLLRSPILTLAMILMLSAELFGGGLGYLAGRMKRL